MNYYRVAACVWMGAFLLWGVSFCMGSGTVTSHTPQVVQTTSLAINKVVVPAYVKPEPNLKLYINTYISDKVLITQIINAINQESKKFNIPKDVLVGLIAQESGFDHTAISNKKAMGLSQINSKIWLQELKNEGIVANKKALLHPAKSIKAGCYVLRKYLDEADRKGVSHRMKFALGKYNGDKSGEYYQMVMEKVEEYKNGLS